MKKKLLFIIIMMFCCLTFKVNALANEEPKQVVKKYFNYAKDYKMEKANKYVAKKKYKIEYKSYDNIPSMKKYIKKYNKKMKINVIDQTINGNKATVKIEAKYYDSSEIMSTYAGLLIVYLLGSDVDNMSEKEQNKIFDKLFKSVLSSGEKPKLKNKTYNIKLISKNGKWYINDKNAYRISISDLYVE